MDVGTFRPKLTIALEHVRKRVAMNILLVTNLCKVLAHVIGSAREVVAEWTRLPRLARALAEELARHMRCVYRTSLVRHATFFLGSKKTYSVSPVGSAALQTCLPVPWPQLPATDRSRSAAAPAHSGC